MRKYQAYSVTFLFLLTVAACSLPQGAGDTSFPNSTAIYRTVAARLTATGPGIPPLITPVASTTSLPSNHPEPSPFPSRTMLAATDTQVVLPSSTPVAIPCLHAAPGRPYVDVTIPDGTRMTAGQPFSKTWRLLNAGSCSWTKEYAIIWFSGENFSTVREQTFSGTIRPGQSVDITVDMLAPRTSGIHQSNWKLRDPRGVLFGIGPTGDAPFWVRIEVEELATPTMNPQPSLTVTPTPATVTRGTLEFIAGKSIDFDTGKFSSGVGDDLQFQKLTLTSFQLTPLNGAKLVDTGSQIATDLDCRGAALSANSIPAENLKEGDVLCYRTTQGLPGYLRVKSISLKDGKVIFDYQTWAIP
jgi:hypothetical protein